ncbi:hypothetical protein [Nonomuraea wenchangensis]|uniref:hypothetical protein n=1 Tax=Nonomuraea wenchangensis TaxID=568860 RepID=UPI003319FF2D
MNNEDTEQPGGITVLAVHTIEVSPDRSGWLNREQVEKAARGANITAAGQAAALIVRGTLNGCDPQSAVDLASLLRQAASVTIYGNGRGIPYLVSYLRSAIAQERKWAAGGCR